MKPGNYSRFTELEIAEIREAHRRRKEALKTVKYLMSKHGITTARFSQIAIGKVDGRKPRARTA